MCESLWSLCCTHGHKHGGGSECQGYPETWSVYLVDMTGWIWMSHGGSGGCDCDVCDDVCDGGDDGGHGDAEAGETLYSAHYFSN